MKKNRLFSISDFAYLSRTTAETLRHYDRIDLLIPELRSDNNYRYYSIPQLSQINLIHTLREMGMTLAEIKAIQEQRTPEKTLSLLTNQIKKGEQKIFELKSTNQFLQTLKKMINSCEDIDETSIVIQFLPEEPMILGDQNNYANGRSDYDALFDFYHVMNERYPALNLNYPVWAIFTKENLTQKEWIRPDYYYFYNPAGLDRRPAGLYAIGYARGGYGYAADLFKQMEHYIRMNNFKICGDAYVEYPLNELCIIDSSNYLIRVIIPVQEQQKND